VPSTPAQGGPIAVYGATGYTGRLVSAELRRRGADIVLAGRNRAKLEILAEDLGGEPAIRAASLDDEKALRDLLEPCAAVIACAGPFHRHGEPVLAAAVDARAHYVDTTGEQPFMRTVFEEYGPRAERAGVALVTAMGFDYVPGDLIAELTADGMGPLDELVLAYAVSDFGATRGTALSALDMLAGGDVEWRDGELVPASQSVGRGTWDFPEPVGRQRMVQPVEDVPVEDVDDDERDGDRDEHDDEARAQLAEMLDESCLFAVAETPREQRHRARSRWCRARARVPEEPSPTAAAAAQRAGRPCR